MNKSNQKITFQGKPLRVTGQELHEGDKMPSFKLTANDMSDLESSKFSGKIVVLSTVPSLDTPTCATQTRKFNEAAADLSDDVVLLTVSMDLPFAQKRWCAAEGLEAAVTGSDYKFRGFGESFGTYIQDMALLARAVFVVDKQGVIQHVEYVGNLSEEPDYEAALKVVSRISK